MLSLSPRRYTKPKIILANVYVTDAPMDFPSSLESLELIQSYIHPLPSRCPKLTLKTSTIRESFDVRNVQLFSCSIEDHTAYITNDLHSDKKCIALPSGMTALHLYDYHDILSLPSMDTLYLHIFKPSLSWMSECNMDSVVFDYSVPIQDMKEFFALPMIQLSDHIELIEITSQSCVELLRMECSGDYMFVQYQESKPFKVTKKWLHKLRKSVSEQMSVHQSRDKIIQTLHDL